MKTDKATFTQIQIIYYLGFLLFTWFGLYFFNGYLFFYQEKSSLFLTTHDFFIQHLGQPGGVLNYLWLLQSAFYFYPVSGSLLVALEMVLIGFLIGKTGEMTSKKKYFFIPFLVISVIYYLQLNYQYLGINTLGVLLQLATYYLTVRYLKNTWSWGVLFLPLFIYFLTGFFSLIYLLMVILHLLFTRDKYQLLKLALLVLITTAGFLAGRAFLFYCTDLNLLMYPFSLQNTGMQGAIFIPLMAFLGIIPVVFKIKSHLWTLPGIKIVMSYAPVPLFLILIGLSVLKADQLNAHYFQVEKLFYEQKYDKVVKYNLEHPSLNSLTVFFNNISLCETGKLNDMLFSFPQSPDGTTLFLKWEMVTEVLKRGGYWYYTLGMINEAQRWAYENMVMKGNTPEGTKMLIKTELINGNYKVASKYISILKNSLFYRQEALSFEKLLYNEPAINSHPEFGKKRKQKPKSDFFVQTDNPLANLEMLVRSDSTNRAALEYHFAWLLLQKNIPGVVESLPLLERAGYSGMPLHIDEAATGFKLVKMGEFPGLQGLDISAPVIQRFDHFYRLLQQNYASRQQAQQALSKEYGRSFWYYYFFM